MRTVLPLLVVGGLILGHLEVLARGPSYAGPLLVVDHLFDLGMAVATVALFVAAGSRLLRAMNLEPESAVPRLLHGVAVGAGVWALIFLTLGIAGLLTPPFLLLAVIVAGFLLRGDLLDIPELCAGVVEALREVRNEGFLLACAVGVSSMAALFIVLHGSAPPGDWDSLMYHLEIPRQWLAEGRIYVPEGNLHVAYVGLLQTLFVPFLAVGSYAGPALLNGLFALLLGLAVFHVGEVLFDVRTGLYSSVILWGSTGLLLVAVTARVDTTLSFYILLGQGAIARTLVEEDDAAAHILRAAIVLALACGIKYHGLAFTAAILPVGLWALWTVPGLRDSRWRLLLVTAGAFLIAWGPWLTKNLVLLGAPFYPFFTERLLQPWLADLYGTRVVPPEVERRAFGALRQAREPFNFTTLLFAPERLTVEPEGVHYHTNALLFLLPLWFLHLRRRVIVALAVPALLYVAGVAVLVSMINLRYLLPALPALTITVSYFLGSVLQRVEIRWVRNLVLGGFALLALVPTARSAYQWTTKAPVVGQAIGSASRQGYLESGFSFYAALATTVNANVPEDGKVLLLWEARGFYLAPDYLPDNVATYWPLLSQYLDRDGGCLEGTGITHVLAATAAARYYRQRGGDPGLLNVEGFYDFADRCLVPMREGPGFSLYRLESAPIP